LKTLKTWHNNAMGKAIKRKSKTLKMDPKLIRKVDLGGKVGPVPGPDGASHRRHPQLELLLAAKVKVFGVVFVGLT
jgi:hypothetical protein